MAAQYDVIVFGATSFVGQILCRYLLEQFGINKSLKWAAAGRSSSKLEQVRSELGAKAKKLPLLVADAADPVALAALCQQTRVMVSTVGPYALYGEPLVKVCAESGTDYCDLTGEVQWIRRMVERYEIAAKQSGARIVHCCGFDSIPSDFGVYFLQQQAQQRFGQPCTRVKMRVKAIRGGPSGGTAASLINVVKEASKDASLRKELANPYSICPPKHGFTARQANVKGGQYDSDFGTWVAPFVMAAINTRVVHRSNALSGNAYGSNFRYDEASMVGRGLKGMLGAHAMGAAMGGFLLASAIPPSRWALERFVLPKVGEGPSPSAQEKGFYDLRFFGKTESGQTLRVKVTGDRDPGYGSTAKMLGQAAACLALDFAKTGGKGDGKNNVGGGFWTPSTLFGDKLLARLTQYAGLGFEVIE
ncbi:MAG: hypothetical protein RL748_552 [Pseudomonadota bacterium]|jgi:short subunit dehydrogenase-like uncharacterized protein